MSDIPPQAASSRELKLEFNGKAAEYFRIWIVNLCLTLMTLGLFSAWAKVRKKRYFYSHTVLDGTPFQYLGQPLPILKGRIVAVVLFLVYYAASHFFTSLMPFVIAGALIAAPWAVARSAAFAARYSAYRNMTFSFTGGYLGAVTTLYWLGLVPLVAIGIAYQAREQSDFGKAAIAIGIAFGLFGVLFPWWLVRLRRFLIGNTAFGGVKANLDITGGQLWGIYFRGGLIMILFGAIAAVLFAASAGSLKAISMGVFGVAMFLFYGGYVLAYGYIQAASGNLVWNNTTLKPLIFASALRGRELAWLYLSNAIAIIASAGLLTPWAVVRTAKYRASRMRVVLDGDLAAFAGGDLTSVQAAGAEVSEIFDLDLSL